jgi:hypothetical protein
MVDCFLWANFSINTKVHRFFDALSKGRIYVLIVTNKRKGLSYIWATSSQSSGHPD